MKAMTTLQILGWLIYASFLGLSIGMLLVLEGVV